MANLEISRRLRLDQYVVQERPLLSRAYAVRLIEGGQVLVNGQPEKPGYKLKADDEVTIDFEEASLDAIPDIDLPVLYEDENVIVINKPAGVISHARGRYWDEPSVASFIRQKVTGEWQGAPVTGLSLRAGIVHRLDRATSGVMLCARNPETLKFLQKQFGDRKVKKTYVAIVNGHIVPQEAIIDMPIGRNPVKPQTFRVSSDGKPAQTAYTVLASKDGYDKVELRPTTGRTHQLRVHLRQLEHPIVGDELYGGEPAKRLFLHAQSLEITLPGGHRTTFTAPLPAIFSELVP